MGQRRIEVAVKAVLAIVIELLLLLLVCWLFQYRQQVLQRRRRLWAERQFHLHKLTEQLEVACGQRIVDFYPDQIEQCLPEFGRCLAGSRAELGDLQLQVLMFRRQQRTIAGGRLLRMRDCQFAGLQQVQHLLELWVAQLA
ncbi:hypothetical protein D3C80_1422310 [compost metagenome]